VSPLHRRNVLGRARLTTISPRNPRSAREATSTSLVELPPIPVQEDALPTAAAKTSTTIGLEREGAVVLHLKDVRDAMLLDGEEPTARSPCGSGHVSAALGYDDEASSRRVGKTDSGSHAHGGIRSVAAGICRVLWQGLLSSSWISARGIFQIGLLYLKEQGRGSISGA
jgi:hypothetical protein